MKIIVGATALFVLFVAQAAHAQDKDKKKPPAAAPAKPAPAKPASPGVVLRPPGIGGPRIGGGVTPSGSAGTLVRPQGGAVSSVVRPAGGTVTPQAGFPHAPGSSTTGGGFPHAPGSSAAAGGGFPRAPAASTTPSTGGGFPLAPSGGAVGGRGGAATRPISPNGGQTVSSQGGAVRSTGGRSGGSTAAGGRRDAGASSRPTGWRVGGGGRSVRRFTYHGRSFAAYRTWPYRYPDGFHYRRFVRGEYVPAAFLVTDYAIVDYGSYGLVGPLPGAEWVRVGPDALMLNGTTGEVFDSAPGLFDESLPPQEEPPMEDPGPPAPVVDPDLPPEFSTGAFQLGHGTAGGCVRFYSDASARAELDASWQGEDWNGVARKVMSLGCETDLSFYLLGLSAEGLGLDQASSIYYSEALSAATKPAINPYRSCKFWKNDACRSVSIADESRAGLQRLNTRR